ncbi:beta-1,4-N-acetylgalactosaminyltransferase bre-4-like [Argonauta hians]
MLNVMKKFCAILFAIAFLIIGYQLLLSKTSFFSHYAKEVMKVTVVSPCLESSRQLVGLQPINKRIHSWFVIERRYSNLLKGGRYKPNCLVNTSVAIVVPYRDREFHLKIFLNNIHNVLQRQLIEYGIYIVEQSDKNDFNRGMLMNVGFAEANKLHNYSCYIFHDVDLIPENDFNIYDCLDSPKHMSVAVDKFGYKLPYRKLFGGVVALKQTDFLKINGFSNRFFAWGGEDDDLYTRISNNNMSIYRHSIDIARYTMLKHLKSKVNQNRWKLLSEGVKKEGLSTLNYTVKNIIEKPLYTKFSVILSKT